MFKVGDKVKIPYISDYNPHNNKVGTIMDSKIEDLEEKII